MDDLMTERIELADGTVMPTRRIGARFYVREIGHALAVDGIFTYHETLYRVFDIQRNLGPWAGADVIRATPARNFYPENPQ